MSISSNNENVKNMAQNIIDVVLKLDIDGESKAALIHEAETVLNVYRLNMYSKMKDKLDEKYGA